MVIPFASDLKTPPPVSSTEQFRAALKASIAQAQEAEEIPPIAPDLLEKAAPPQMDVVDALTGLDLATGEDRTVRWEPEHAPRPIEPMAITPEQVLKILQPFGFLCGRAGTGKTTLARMLHEGRDDTILCATTGIAAVNLGNATTLNSLLHYFDTRDLLEKHSRGYVQFRLQQLRKAGLRLILVDEVSMLPADQLAVLVDAFQQMDIATEYDRALYDMGAEQDMRMKLLLVGDFAQLPPVEAPYAFEAPEWKEHFAPATLKLEKVWRQENQEFAGALHAVRLGKPGEALKVLQGNFHTALDFRFEGTTIVAKNAMVDAINNRRHAEIDGEPLVWKAITSGEQDKDWKNIPPYVSLKPGALVMCLMNRPRPTFGGEGSTDYFYVNGDLGHIVELDMPPTAPDATEGNPTTIPTALGIKVKLVRTGEIVTVVPHTKEWVETVSPPEPVDAGYVPKPGETIGRAEGGGRQITKRLKGAITYMPLRLAYATTVHKSQGLSLDRVQVAIGDWMFQKPGMMYVALSRCRTLEGLRIIGTPKQFMARCAVSKKVEPFL